MAATMTAVNQGAITPSATTDQMQESMYILKLFYLVCYQVLLKLFAILRPT
jgi:hypothetical protein